MPFNAGVVIDTYDFAAVNLDDDTVIAWIPTLMDAVVDQLAAMARLPATLWFGL